MSAFDGKADQQSSQFDLDVVEHEINGDITSLDAHIFTIEIWLNQEPYRVRRSYKEICEFDVRLNKQYPKTILPPCPFSSSMSSIPQGVGEKKGGIRGSFVALKNNTRRGSLNDMSEDVSHKKPALLSYLKLLLLIPEIVRSTNMLDFLDMASKNGEGYEEENINLLEMLLDGTPEKSVNIVKKHTVKFEVLAGQYIVWTFSTKKRDLGFSIDINDDNVLTYQRYNCHEQSISNVLKCPFDGEAVLRWDNTYSKLRTKHLMFRCAVLSSDLYKEHSKKCIDLSREQQAHHTRRNALQRELIQISHQLLSSQGGRLISQDFTVEMTSGDKVVHEDLQMEICTLTEQKKSLQNALSESEIALADIRQELAVMKKSLERNQTITEELERVTSERDELQQEILDESMTKKKLEIDLQAMQGELIASQERLEAQVNQNQADEHALASLQHQQTLLHDENSQLMAEIAQLKSAERSGGAAGADVTAQIQRLKGEKKQLKAYAISLKGQLEVSERERLKVQPSESDKQVAQNLVQKMTPLLATLEAELQGLKSLRDQADSSKKEKGATDDNDGEGDFLEKTTAALESGMNTTDNVSVMLKYANMKLTDIDSSDNTSNTKNSDHVGKSASEVIPEHKGSVYAPMVSTPSTPGSTNNSSPPNTPTTHSNHSSPSKQAASPSNAHPATCNCMKCKAPPKRPSMMETMINTFLDVEDSVDKRLSNSKRKSTTDDKL